MKKQHGGSRPGAGRKRTATLPKEGKLFRLPPVLVSEETIKYLHTLPSLSEFVRQAIAEKREME